jgi:hypothetical protein
MSRINIILGVLIVMGWGQLLGFAESEANRVADRPSAVSTGNQSSGENYFRKPLLGYVPDAGQRKLRPVWGTPGASTLGDPLQLTHELLWVVPGKDAAVVRSKANLAGLALVSLPEVGTVEMPIPGSSAEMTMLAQSSSGAAAAMVLAGGNRLLVITGLPDHALATQLDISSLPEEPVSLAISESAQVLIGLKRGSGGEIHLVQRDGSSRLVAIVSDPKSLKFFPTGNAALVVDAAAGTVSLIDLSAASGASPIAGQADGIAQPLDVEISDDGERIFVLNTGGTELVTLEPKTGGNWSLPLSRRVSGFSRLGERDLFQMTECCDQPVLLLDAAGINPRLVFVPAIKRTRLEYWSRRSADGTAARKSARDRGN